MNKTLEIIKQAKQFRKTLQAFSPDSEEYQLGEFYKDQLEKLQNAEINEETIDQLIEKVESDMKANEDSEEVTEMLSTVLSLLNTVKHFF